MPRRVAVKRLSKVEVDATRSNQHEFHAGRLRKELGLPEKRLTGKLLILILGPDGSEPVSDEAQFTLYDARQQNPRRASEWHLYYSSKRLPELAEANDLMLLYAHGPDLRAVVARKNSEAERRILDALAMGDDAVEDAFRFFDDPGPDASAAQRMATQLTLPLGPEAEYGARGHSLARRAVREGRMPSTRELASAAGTIAAGFGSNLDADDYITRALTAETELYFSIEGPIHQAGLASLLEGQPSVTQVIDFAMSIQQSRRARRGQSLQNHFAMTLERDGIPYTAQCVTEPGETPDFIVPGCAEYHDNSFPATHLRMVACKSTAKERWRQILNEAGRIPEKYLLTLDPDLTGATIDAMSGANVRVFVPRTILETSYVSPAAGELGSVGQLVDRLREAAKG